MNDVLDAIKLIKEWNSKTLDEVVKEIENYTGIKITKEDAEDYRVTGLNNIDFIKLRMTDFII